VIAAPLERPAVKAISANPSPGVEESAVGATGAIGITADVMTEVPTTPLGAAELVAVTTDLMNLPTSPTAN
jgi:hypothetical protein